VAVGEALYNAGAPELAAGHGRLLATLTHWGDCLCLLGAAAGASAPPGFSAEAVCELAVDAALPLEEASAASAALAQLHVAAAEPADTGGGEPPPAAAGASPAAAMDALLDASLLQALRSRIKDRDLPVACGALLSAHLAPARPAGSVLDVRASSHRQLSHFLQAKAAEGLITLKHDDRKGELFVVAVRRGHPALLAHVPHETHDAAAAMAAAEGAPQPLHAQELLLASSCAPLLALLRAAGVEAAGEALTAQQVNEALRRYLESQGLPARGSTARRCLLDPLLCDALFAPGSPAPLPTELLLADIGPLLLSRFAPAHRLWRGGEAEAPLARRGALPTVRLAHESRSKGKLVTVIARLEPFCIAPPILAAQLRERFAASCTVAELPRPAGLAARAATPAEVVLQGERAAEVAAFLSLEWGRVPCFANRKGVFSCSADASASSRCADCRQNACRCPPVSSRSRRRLQKHRRLSSQKRRA
jgi:translation initiation factor 1 (eIF-1/SUI1)